jgi:hypothetical protein
MGKPTPLGLLANFIAQITPVFLESMRLIAIHEPEKPLAALGNFFLGVPIVACAVHTPYRRDGPEAAMVMEVVRLLACSNVRPEEPAKWMGDWPLVFSIHCWGQQRSLSSTLFAASNLDVDNTDLLSKIYVSNMYRRRPCVQIFKDAICRSSGLETLVSFGYTSLPTWQLTLEKRVTRSTSSIKASRHPLPPQGNQVIITTSKPDTTHCQHVVHCDFSLPTPREDVGDLISYHVISACGLVTGLMDPNYAVYITLGHMSCASQLVLLHIKYLLRASDLFS